MKNGSNTNQNMSAALRITYTGIAINVFLALVKFITGYIGSSQAVIADAFHSLSDLITDFAIILGIRFWSAPADEDHQYGHSKIETMVTVFISAGLFATGLGIGYSAIRGLWEGVIYRPSAVALTGIVFSIVLKELLFHWTKNTADRIKSNALKANAWHHRSDAFSSIPALIAVTASIISPALSFLDAAGAVIVSMFIIRVAWKLIKPALAELSDMGLPAESLKNVEIISYQTEGVREVHGIRSRLLGSGFLVDIHVLVDDELSVREGHEIAKKVKYSLISGNLDIIDAMIHIEPFNEATQKRKKVAKKS